LPEREWANRTACHSSPPQCRLEHTAASNDPPSLATTPHAARPKRPTRGLAPALQRPLQQRSVVAIDPLAPLVCLLRLERQGRDRARSEALHRDRLAGLLEIAVGPVFDPRQRRVDLGDKLALAVTGTQLDRAVGFRGCPVGKIGMVLALLLQVGQRLPAFLEDLFLPQQQLLAKILTLTIVHERLVLVRTIVGFQLNRHFQLRLSPRPAAI